MEKKIEAYLKNHYLYNSIIHLIAGVGIGIIVTYPFVGAHPVRWGVAFLILGIAGHMYPLFVKHK